MILFDAGMLIALDRGDLAAWARYKAIRLQNVRPIVTGPVLAQVWRGGPATHLSRALSGCQTVAFDSLDAKPVGELCTRAGLSDVVDAHVAYVARRAGSVILTSDSDDLLTLARAGGYPTEVISL